MRNYEELEVKDNRPTIYHPTVAHHHEPVKEPGEWNEVCKEAAKDQTLIFTLKKLAENNASPETVASMAKISLFGASIEFMGLAHFDYYLSGGGGVRKEDANLKSWIEGDGHARDVIAKRIIAKRNQNPGQSSVEDSFEYNATMF